MTNGKKSKITAAWAAFLVGSLTGIVGTSFAVAQTAEPGSAIPALEIRGSIAETEDKADQGQSGGGPLILETENLQNTRGNESFSTSENLENGEVDLGTAEGRRQQFSTNRGQAEIQRASAVRQRRAQAIGPVGTDPGDPDASTRANVAAQPIQSGTQPESEDDPFAATGIRLGSFDIQLSLEQSVGYSSNVSSDSDADAGGFSQTDMEVSITSDWSRHEWQTNLAGSYRLPLDSEEVDEPLFFADTQLRLDLVDGYTLTGSGFYTVQTQEFTDTTLASGAVDTPLEQNYGGSLELERSARKLVFALRGSVEREVFEDADLGGGVTQIQEDQDNNLYSFALRAGYEVSPAIVPFVEGIYSIRNFDLELDRNGNRRDGDIYELRAGVAVDLDEKLQGEVSFGYLTEQFDDPLIDDLTGFTVNGEFVWSPERDTEVTLTFGTETNNSIALNDNGSLTYNARIGFERQVSDRFSVDGFAGVEIETNDDRNTTIEVGIGTQYWVNRFMALTGDIEYENFSSDAADSGFDEVSGRLGIRLQR
ncbi:MAG: outer membrane beta-barrel protein [Rhizobiaceae bacterium]